MSEEALQHLSFEEAISQLEAVVTRLEEGGLPLEEALQLFEKGVALSRRCYSLLEKAQGRIEELVSIENGKVVLKPLDTSVENPLTASPTEDG